MKPFLVLFVFLVSTQLQGQSLDSLVIGYKVSPPFVTEGPSGLEGPSVWLLNRVMGDLNRPYRMQKLNLDQLLAGLQSGKIDMSLTPLTLTSERAKQFDFSVPYYIAHSSILIRKASPIEKLWQFVASFFSIHFFRALGALALVILIFGFLAWLFERKENPEEFGPGWKGLWQGFWWSAVTMTTVGYGDKSPRTAGGRIVALVWMFTAIIIISGFTAGIASSLTVNQLSWSQNSIEDFKDKMLGTISNSGTERWLDRNFYKKKKSYASLEAMQEALVDKDIDAIAYDRPLLSEMIRMDSLGKFELLPISYNSQFYAMGLNRALEDSLETQISTLILENIEGMDWKVVLSEYNLTNK